MAGGPDSTAPRALTKLFKCLECGKVKEKTRKWQKFCKSKCRDAWHNRNRILAEVTEADLKEIKK